jgi:hypothetical protein
LTTLGIMKHTHQVMYISPAAPALAGVQPQAVQEVSTSRKGEYLQRG